MLALAVPFASSQFITISKGLVLVVSIPEITLSSVGNPSKFIAYNAFPIHLFSWKNGYPISVEIFEVVICPVKGIPS